MVDVYGNILALLRAMPALAAIVAIVGMNYRVLKPKGRSEMSMFKVDSTTETQCSICGKDGQLIEVTSEESPHFSGVVCMKHFALLVRNRQNGKADPVSTPSVDVETDELDT